MAGVLGARGANVLVETLPTARSPESAPAPTPRPSVGARVMEVTLQEPVVVPDATLDSFPLSAYVLPVGLLANTLIPALMLNSQEVEQPAYQSLYFYSTSLLDD